MNATIGEYQAEHRGILINIDTDHEDDCSHFIATAVVNGRAVGGSAYFEADAINKCRAAIDRALNKF